MAHPLVSFVGRDAELAAISLAIQEADQGRGGSWLLSGAPGIGKSRLAEEVARSATDAGFVVGWGRCWESGGAPAFWPWIQSLRALYRCSDAGALSPDIRERLLPLLPELAPYATEATPASGRGLEDRFELLDEVTSAICALAVSRPLLIILDDLHAADHSSLALLDFASRQLYASRVVVLGTFRAHDAQRSQHAALIARIAQDANTIPLGPLDTVALEAYLADAAGGVINASLAASLHARTEGNPLFMVELVRLIASDPTMTAETLVQTSLPPGLEQALRAHVGALSSSSRAVLEMAAIIGREFGTEALARHFEIPFDRAHAAVGEAVALGLLQVAGDDYYRFCHILLRDVLEGDADEMHRKALHRRFAESLATRHEGRDPRWSEIAHHFELAGHACRTQTVDALTRAGESATSKLAFEDAAIVYRRGLLLLDRAGSDDKGQRAELLIGLCRALVGAGQREAGRECCREAAALARELKDATLLARACLEFGSILVFGNVDPHLIVMLQEALDALPPGDGSLRAHVQARLAAAMQPATDPSVPIELAIDAIGMARRLEEPVTMLAVLRSGCSAMVDMAPPEVRLPFDREHATRATELGAKRDALLAQTRLIFDCIQLADRLGADAAVRAATALILQIDHRSVAWLLPGMEAMRQLWCSASAGTRLQRAS